MFVCGLKGHRAESPAFMSSLCFSGDFSFFK